MYTDTDKTFAGVLSACVSAGPSRCALARANATAASLEKDIFSLFERLKHRPVTIAGLLIDHTLVRSFVLLSLYDIEAYPALMALLDALLRDDLAALAALMAGGFASAGNDAEKGIQCGDKGGNVSAAADPARNGFDETALPVMEAVNVRSRVAGDSAAFFLATCGRWRTQVRERYAGGFTQKTRNPMLVIGNTHDLVTPFESARNVSEGFEGSVLLKHDEFKVSASFLICISLQWKNADCCLLLYSMHLRRKFRFALPEPFRRIW